MSFAGRASVALVVLSLWATVARAHHPVAETFTGHAQPASRAGVDVEFAPFDLAGLTGSYVTLGLRGDFAPFAWLSVGGRVPFHHIRIDGDDARTGLGDVDLALKLRVFGDHRLVVSAGLGVELPTGDEHDAMGSGHVELSPFASGMIHFDGWMLHGTLADSLSLAADDGHEHLNVISPHADHELRYHLGLSRALGEQFFANLVVGGATVLSEEDRGTTLLTVGPQIGWMPSADWRLTASVDVPITSEKRYEWKAISSAQYLF